MCGENQIVCIDYCFVMILLGVHYIKALEFYLGLDMHIHNLICLCVSAKCALKDISTPFFSVVRNGRASV